MDLESQLPVELEERVLSFVGVPSLCRIRRVCKRWNQIISDPYFPTLCVQSQAKIPAPFLILHHSVPSHTWWKPSQQYCILDLRARRWYQPADVYEAHLRVVDMDGGLVLGEYPNKMFQTSALLVFNPLDKTEKDVLPAPYYSSTICSIPLLSLVVDNVAKTFKIIRLEEDFEGGTETRNSISLQIYNSATKEWKCSTNPWCESGPRFEGEEYAWLESRVMFQRCLYVLVKHTSQRRSNKHRIWRYDLLRDLWEHMSILMDTGRPLPGGKLIVSAGRLFLVSQLLLLSHLNEFEVTEINIRRMTCETLFKWTKAQVLELFDMEDDGDGCSSIDAFGFDNSLMFMPYGSSPGKLRAFDFVTRKWDCEWPRHSLELLPSCYWEGKQMNFLLPGTPW